MSLKGLLVVVYLDLLIPLAVLLNIYLYFYPVFHFCSFQSSPDGQLAPFRLLALADPQLEGDTTLLRYASQHKPDDPLLSYLDPQHLARDFHRIRKTIDLWGNDLYLSHIYKTVRRGTQPTHTVVLGDLLGSQWIGADEFQKRGDRFWSIFANASLVDASDIADGSGADGGHWRRKIITLPGNHDIGYPGDVSRDRLDRFERMFGPVNYKLDFPAPSPSDGGGGGAHPLQIVVLNSMTLDEPISDAALRDASYSLLSRASTAARTTTLLLTHLPLHRPAGVCVDPPLFTYFPSGGIREQNHLRETTSAVVLDALFNSSGSPGFILTGHDHEGCDVNHYRDGSTGDWDVAPWRRDAEAGVREVTVRSMMGGYGGNAGLLSAWWDRGSQCMPSPTPFSYDVLRANR